MTPVTGASNGMGLSMIEYLLAKGDIVIAAVCKPESMREASKLSYSKSGDCGKLPNVRCLSNLVHSIDVLPQLRTVFIRCNPKF